MRSIGYGGGHRARRALKKVDTAQLDTVCESVYLAKWDRSNCARRQRRAGFSFWARGGSYRAHPSVVAPPVWLFAARQRPRKIVGVLSGARATSPPIPAGHPFMIQRFVSSTTRPRSHASAIGKSPTKASISRRSRHDCETSARSRRHALLMAQRAEVTIPARNIPSMTKPRTHTNAIGRSPATVSKPRRSLHVSRPKLDKNQCDAGGPKH